MPPFDKNDPSFQMHMGPTRPPVQAQEPAKKVDKKELTKTVIEDKKKSLEEIKEDESELGFTPMLSELGANEVPNAESDAGYNADQDKIEKK